MFVFDPFVICTADGAGDETQTFADTYYNNATWQADNTERLVAVWQNRFSGCRTFFKTSAALGKITISPTFCYTVRPHSQGLSAKPALWSACVILIFNVFVFCPIAMLLQHELYCRRSVNDGIVGYRPHAITTVTCHLYKNRVCYWCLCVSVFFSGAVDIAAADCCGLVCVVRILFMALRKARRSRWRYSCYTVSVAVDEILFRISLSIRYIICPRLLGPID